MQTLSIYGFSYNVLDTKYAGTDKTDLTLPFETYKDLYIKMFTKI